jgi:hypothetical protein
MNFGIYKLTGSHRVNGFDCGRTEPNRWLRKRALGCQNESAWTFAAVLDEVVVGYYTLMPGRVTRADGGTGAGCPVMLLPRLAAHRTTPLRMRKELLRDAVLWTLRAAEAGRVRALVAYSADEEERRFYAEFDFRRAAWDAWVMVLRLRTRKSLHSTV